MQDDVKIYDVMISFTREQLEIIDEFTKQEQPNPVIVNASAGSGKTFTAIEMFHAFFEKKINPIDKEQKGLYLVFNKSMADMFRSISKKHIVRYDETEDKNITLYDYLNIKTYHSFLKANNNMEYALSKMGVKNLDGVLINYQKSGLNQKDILRISKNIANKMYEYGLIKYDGDINTTAQRMLLYANRIKEEVRLFLDNYFKTGLNINDEVSVDIAFSTLFPNIEKLELLPTKDINSVMDIVKNQNKNSISYFFASEINNALDLSILNKQIEIWHGYYYKKIYETAMSEKEFLYKLFDPYDVITIDEAQDADEMIFNLIRKYQVLNNLSKRKNVKFICFGDPKQSIYGFNGSFNIYEWAEKNYNQIKEMNLTKSFRFGQNIADLSMLIAKNYHPNDTIRGRDLKQDLVIKETKNINELAEFILQMYSNENKFKTGTSRHKDNMAIICRTNNACLNIFNELKNTIDNIIKNKNANIEFSSDYIILDPSIKNSFKGIYKKKLISIFSNNSEKQSLENILKNKGVDKNIENITVFEAIQDETISAFLKSSGDYDFLFKYDEKFLDKFMKSRAKRNAMIIITNVHQSKGLEYPIVVVGDDFFKRKNEYFCDKEEVNIAHTAITRGKSKVMFLESSGKNLINYFYQTKTSPKEDSIIDYDLLKKTEKNTIATEKELDKNLFLQNSNKIKI